MVLPQGVFCPYNAQATLHLYEAFVLYPWRMYNVCTTSCEVLTNFHNYLHDFYSEPLQMIEPHPLTCSSLTELIKDTILICCMHSMNSLQWLMFYL